MEVIFNVNEVNNKNTGICYEIAIFLRLLNDDERNNQLSLLKDRDDIDKIQTIYSQLKIDLDLSKYGIDVINKIKFTSQDDSVGPSDIIINDILGLSIKYNNNCIYNPSGSHFLTKVDIKNIKEEQINFTNGFIKENYFNYGQPENWFRNRKIKSQLARDFINKIKNKIIDNWNNNIIDKSEIINKIYQTNSPINYIIVNIDNGYSISIDDNSYNFNIDNIHLYNDPNTDYIIFRYYNKDIGKMQIKFNNGILEKSKSKKSKYILSDGTLYKLGNCISSWNYNKIK